MKAKQLKPGIGLDIGSHAIKMVEVVAGAKGLRVHKFCHQVIPQAIASDPHNEEMLAELIREMRFRARIRTRRVYLSASGHQVVLHRAVLPKMPLNELADAAKWNAREEVLFPIEEAVADYDIVGETIKEGVGHYELLSVVAHQEGIHRLVAIAQQAGLKVAGITALPLALWDYDRALTEPEPGGATCLIDMGAERTRIYFVSDRDLLLSREIPSGGNQITDALAGVYQTTSGSRVDISLQRAEEIKIHFGLTRQTKINATEEDIPLAEVRQRGLPAVAKQVEEIVRSMDYFRELFKMTAVDRVILSGGAGSLRGFAGSLKKALRLPIEYGNPLRQLPSSAKDTSEDTLRSVGPALMAAAGLSIGRCGKINLLPEEYRFSLKRSLQNAGQAALIPAFVMALLIVSVVLRGKITHRNNLLQVKAQVLTNLQTELQAINIPKKNLDQLISQKLKLKKEREALPVKTPGRVTVPQILHEIARMVAWNQSLEMLSFNLEVVEDDEENYSTGSDFVIKGTIFGSKTKVLSTLEKFLRRLQASPLVVQVKLLDSRTTDLEKYTRRGLDFSVYVQSVPTTKIQL